MGSYIPNTEAEQQQMLEQIGMQTMEDLFVNIPEVVKVKGELQIPPGKSELEVQRTVAQMAGKNQIFTSIFRGAGAYRHFIPAIVKSVMAKENFMTVYTPYQAEVSQGILQSIFEYQTMICDLTGMEAANASVYDGATAAAEALVMCAERKRKRVLVAATVMPSVLATIGTYCFGNELELVLVPEKDGRTDLEQLKTLLDEETAGVYLQHPNYYGNLELAEEIGELVHEAGGKFVMGVNPIALGLLKTPREYGADIAVGDGQPLGLPLGFGGPYLGFMACTEKMTRRLPGRIVGETKDQQGRTGYVLTLQAREQHIRRDKASSNVCSNQALCALGVSAYLSVMGPEGLRQAALQCTSKAHYLAAELERIGYTVENQGEYFHEFITSSSQTTEAILAALEARGILGGYPLDEHRILWCCTEMNSKAEIDAVIQILKEV